MKLLRGKIGKHVWFDDERWTVVRVISPTKHDDYILVSRPDDTHEYEDGTVPVVMALIDCHNDEFVPCTARADRMMCARKKSLQVADEQVQKQRGEVVRLWLECFRRT